jgi:(p)ppGpp synthase/HD superfamily hydrolase
MELSGQSLTNLITIVQNSNKENMRRLVGQILSTLEENLGKDNLTEDQKGRIKHIVYQVLRNQNDGFATLMLELELAHTKKSKVGDGRNN